MTDPKMKVETDQWKPIETAPVGKAVRLGWWEGGRCLTWRSGAGVVTRKLFSGRKTGREFGRDYATHWKPLPDPPEQEGGDE